MCKISKVLLDILIYKYSNVKDNGIIKQYLFTEETTIEEARDFMKYYYPDVDFESLINKC